jgi:hypothetical protein
VSQSTLRRLTVIVRSQSASLALPMGPKCGATPALHTRISMCPCQVERRAHPGPRPRDGTQRHTESVTACPARLIRCGHSLALVRLVARDDDASPRRLQTRRDCRADASCRPGGRCATLPATSEECVGHAAALRTPATG